MTLRTVSLAAASAGQVWLAKPEMALTALLPYRLTAPELPDGYTVYEETASPNAALAFSAAPADRLQALRALQDSGRISGLQQTFVPSTPANTSLVRLVVALYGDSAAAGAALSLTAQPGAAAAVEITSPNVGDRARALHAAAAAGVPESYLTVWSTGSLLLATTVQGPDATADRAARFAQAAQTHAAVLPVAGLAPALLAVPDDDLVLGTAAAAETAQLLGDAASPSFLRAGAYLWSNEQVVLDARQPELMADLVEDQWRRIAAAAEYFTATDASRAVLTCAVIVFGDAAGAQFAVADVSLGPTTRQAVLRLDPPAQLGEEALAYKSVLIWPRGEIRDSYTLQWRHANVVLSVTVNLPPTNTTPAYLGAVAGGLDAAYNRVAPLVTP